MVMLLSMKVVMIIVVMDGNDGIGGGHDLDIDGNHGSDGVISCKWPTL